MAQEPGVAQKRVNVPYFEGVNRMVDFNVGKPTEFSHAENARSRTIGAIEKRQGQVVLGVTSSNQPFVASANYGLFRFQSDLNINGLYRISTTQSSNLSIQVNDNLRVIDVKTFTGSSSLPLTISVSDSLSITDIVNNTPSGVATIYYINASKQWIPLSGGGTGFAGGNFDATYAEQCLFLVNFNSPNRYIKSDGVTVVDSTDGTGHLFNSPPSSKVNYYKQRMYLADYTVNGIRYPTTVLRSSYAMGILSLVNTDTIGATTGAEIPVTDARYFYTASGANTYDVYRGNNLIVTFTCTKVNETSVVASFSGTIDFLASDEIWIGGTFSGTKVFRWVNNPTISGITVKQYDTFKLSGGDNTPVTLLDNIGNIMLVSTRLSMASWNDYTLENFDMNVGCVAERGYVKLLGTLYFLSYNGIYGTSGSVPKLISSKVEKYISGASKLGKENAAAGKKGTSIFFAIGDVNLYNIDGSLEKVIPDTCLEFNTTQQNWFVHTNVKANDFETWIDALDTDRLMLTDTGGNHSVKEFLSGETDDGIEIPFRIDTMYLTLQAPWENLNNLVTILVDVDRGSAGKVFIDLGNGDGYYPLPGNLLKGLSNIKVLGKDPARGQPPVARLVSISIRDSSKQICKYSRMSLIFIPTTNDDPINQ